MPKFKDPKTGQVVNVNSFLVFLCCFLFGMFFFLYIGETQHALVMVGFAILIALVAVFIDITAILFALIFPIVYSFIAPKIVKDKWLNKGYIRMPKKSLASTSEVKDIKKVENIENQEIIEEVKVIENQEIIIEAVKLAIEIQKYAPSNFTKDSEKEVFIYNSRSYYFRIEQLYSQNASYIGSKVLISRNDYAINDGRLLKVDITNDFELIEVYYNDISRGNISRMKELLESYKDNEVQLNKSP